jgi:hypothetical protein
MKYEVGVFTPQTKGMDIGKVSSARIPDELDHVHWSLKYDGHYVQIHRLEDEVVWFSSSGKIIGMPTLLEGRLLLALEVGDIVEAEYHVGEGKLGDRVKCGRQTTRRVEALKGVNILPWDDSIERIAIFSVVQGNKQSIADVCNTMLWKDCFMVKHTRVRYKNALYVTAKKWIDEGYEGIVVRTIDWKPSLGKPRTPTLIKLKHTREVLLKCVGTIAGKGKYKGQIGSLVLNTSGNVPAPLVNVGSGLTDAQRGMPQDFFIGRLIRIAYFDKKKNYTQPRVVSVGSVKV